MPLVNLNIAAFWKGGAAESYVKNVSFFYIIGIFQPSHYCMSYDDMAHEEAGFFKKMFEYCLLKKAKLLSFNIAVQQA